MNQDVKNELTELESILFTIDKLDTNSTEDIPSGYFESMEDRFFAKLNSDTTPKAASISIFENKRIAYNLAAVLAFAILGLGLFSILKPQSKNQLSQNEVIHFLEEEGEITTPLSDSNSTLDKLSDEEIKKFLSEIEGMDVTNIN